MATHQNIFKAGAEPTFAVPVAMFNRLLTAPGMKDSTKLLYLFLLSRAKGPTFRIHVGTILEATGLARQTYITARTVLVKEKLILCEETKKKGFWQFEILGKSGGSLPTHDDWVKFSELPAESIAAYYSERLGVEPDEDEKGDLKFPCPFHNHSTNKRPLLVTIKSGDSLNGRYICGDSRSCGKYGGLVDFEQQYWHTKRRASITRSEASSHVRDFFVAMRPGQYTRPVEPLEINYPPAILQATMVEEDERPISP